MKTARLFKNGQSQAVRLPKEFRFEGEKVFIKKVGNATILLYHKKNRAALEKFTLALDIMPFDEEVTHYYGAIRAYLEKKRTPIGALDLMIAAHAQCLKSTLVTNNVKEFSRVPKLKIENWLCH